MQSAGLLTRVLQNTFVHVQRSGHVPDVAVLDLGGPENLNQDASGVLTQRVFSVLRNLSTKLCVFTLQSLDPPREIVDLPDCVLVPLVRECDPLFQHRGERHLFENIFYPAHILTPSSHVAPVYSHGVLRRPFAIKRASTEGRSS